MGTRKRRGRTYYWTLAVFAVAAMLGGCAIQQAKQAATKADSDAVTVCNQALGVHAQACVSACIPKLCAKDDQSCNKAFDACAEKNPECKLVEPCAKAKVAGVNGPGWDYWSRACMASMRSDPVCGDALDEAQQAHANVQQVRPLCVGSVSECTGRRQKAQNDYSGGGASFYSSPAYLQMQNQAVQQQAQQMQQLMQQQGQEQMREMRPTQVEIVP
jgi:hypothetical protein